MYARVQQPDYLWAQHEPNTIQQMPCGIIADTQSAAQLNGRDASLVGSAQIDRPEPDGQRQMGAVHDSSGGNRGLMAAGTALKSIPSTNRIVFCATTYRADESIRKSKPKQFRSASILGAVKCTKFLECDLNRFCHDNVPLFSWGYCLIFSVQYAGHLQDLVVPLIEKLNAGFSYTLDQNTCI